MAEVILSANSNAWGSTLSLKSTFTWQSDSYDPNVTVNIKTEMYLKSGAGNLNITPPVYCRIYCGGICKAEIKNKTPISHHSTNTNYVLFEKTVTLSRGADYDFELEYSNAWLNGTNIGITTQHKTAHVNQQLVPTLTLTKATATEKLDTTDTTKKLVTVTIAATSETSAVWTCWFDVYDESNTCIDSYTFPNTTAKTSASFTKVITFDTDKTHTVRGKIIQLGAFKDFEIKIVGWSPPVIKSWSVGRTYNSITVDVVAIDLAGSGLNYKFTCTNKVTGAVQTIGPQTSTSCTFTGLSAETTYTIEMSVTDAHGFTVKKTYEGTTTAAPELTGWTPYQGVFRECVPYYYDSATDTFRLLKAAAVIEDGVVKSVTST